ncbi:MAG: GIY-YIG nuclease family protein [Candidatus Curtissbacteria bacterium]
MTKRYFVYIATNKTTSVLYIGVTNDLVRRMYEHKNKLILGFTSKYNVTKLIYYEIYNTAIEAITREKQLKAGSRAKKIKLIEKMNPKYEDLYSNII